MSSIPEWKLGAYVDGELSPAEVREVEAELVRSRRARELVLALREEAGLFGDVLQEREAPRPAMAEAPHTRFPCGGACWGASDSPLPEHRLCSMIREAWLFRGRCHS